ncbi:alpha/beta fold hydrolase [Paractinoplanes globisporus]|uniref:Alpha/beta fold hydrolase n=1 Tax=Paractinoplanes globisporus TaxID=113565 RepID=A0ABW6W3K3_9ACTN|nr:alpha/beta fold hydrolase [Actinoplanes globisporus]
MTVRRARIETHQIAYEERGAGEPVVFIHAGLCADWFANLMDEPALAGAYRLIRCHRPGYGDSDRIDGPVTVARLAHHCAALLRYLGIERAHLVGHSSSAVIALQLAIDRPDLVSSLALLETALLAIPSGQFAADAMRAYLDGDPTAAVDRWMRGVGGSGYRDLFDAVLPGAIERAETDAGTFFGQELPAVRAWAFGRAEAGAIGCPVLLVVGERSKDLSPVFDERHALLRAWLPRAESFELPGANHLMHLQNPGGLAERLAAFLSRHSAGRSR